jgi:hypothetical protein
MTELTYYMLLGIITNLIYDLIVSYLGKEELRFTNTQRLFVAATWPMYMVAFIYKYLKTKFNGNQ